ncbi:MAG TPA: Fur family transcriptional regulator [bacterium]|nr:Fur family transcriptional regulator [bacterium]HPN30155.1 Fur family transcriptional regulator [bacterium]
MRFKHQAGWCHKLRECGCKMTQPRQIIIEFLSNNYNHLTAEEIFFELRKKFRFIGLTTVYRTLELLVRNGILNKFDIGDGSARFEMAFDKEDKQHHHHHLICQCCGTIINYNDFIEDELKFLKKLETELSKKYDFKINNHLIQFRGLCKKCKEKEN